MRARLLPSDDRSMGFPLFVFADAGSRDRLLSSKFSRGSRVSGVESVRWMDQRKGRQT